VSGGNIDVTILSRVINRGLLKSGRLCKLSIELMDKPGQLRDVSTIIAEQGANVVSVNYEHAGKGSKVNDCILSIELETKNSEHIEEVRSALLAEGFKLI
jgi:threonine dehydratase